MVSQGRSNKSKGYRGETEFVQAAIEAGFAGCGRNGSIYGQKDRGDVHGIPGWVVQIKNVAVLKIPEYLKDAKEQAANAGVSLYCLAFKLKGKHMREGVIVLPMNTWFGMLTEKEERDAELKALRRLLRPEDSDSPGS